MVDGTARHVPNPAVGRQTLFVEPDDAEAIERVLEATRARHEPR